MTDLCLGAVALFDSLLQNANSDEAKVFYHKTSGDFMRYVTEYSLSSQKTQNATKTLKSYYQADQLAKEQLPVTHPYRLGLNLNLAIFFKDIMSDCPKAYKLAKETFDAAIDEMDTVKDEHHKDACLTMQLIKNNMMTWQQEALEPPPPKKEKSEKNNANEEFKKMEQFDFKKR